MPHSTPQDWFEISTTVWLSGILGLVTFSGVSYLLLLRRITGGQPAPPDWAEDLRELLRQRKIARTILLLMTRNTGPALCGTPWGYRICVPGLSWAKLTVAQRHTVLRHELAHFERFDLWWLLLARLLALPHWFNPVAWWIVHQITQSAEWACDEAATGPKPEDAVAFARALMQFGVANSFGICPARAVGRSSLFVRIRRLTQLKSQEDSRMKKGLIMALAAGLVVVNLVRIELVAKEPATGKPVGNASHSTALSGAEVNSMVPFDAGKAKKATPGLPVALPDGISVSYNSQLQKYELVAGDMRANARDVSLAAHSAGEEPAFGAILAQDVVVQSPGWNAKAERLETFRGRAILLAKLAGEITVEVEGCTAKASRAEIDSESGKVKLFGPVTIEGKGFQLAAKAAVYEFESRNVRLFAARITRGNERIEAKQAKFDLRTKQITERKD